MWSDVKPQNYLLCGWEGRQHSSLTCCSSRLCLKMVDEPPYHAIQQVQSPEADGLILVV